MTSANQQSFRILAIDGGGIRGIYAAHILKKTGKELNVDFTQEFDLIAGTSTGSIIAAALAVGVPLDRVCSLYEDTGHIIFSRKSPLGGLLSSKYGKSALQNELREVFGERTLAEASTRLLIPSTDIANGTFHVFKSPYCDDFVRDKNVKIVDAVLASCSAPLYFDPQRVGEYLLSDGGLWANNPALVAYVEAVARLQVDPSSIRLLSIGTGSSRSYYAVTARETRLWGIIRWGPSKLVRMVLNLQSASAKNMVELLLPSGRCLRIDFETDRDLPLDDVGLVADLKSRADYAFSRKVKEIRNVLNKELA